VEAFTLNSQLYVELMPSDAARLQLHETVERLQPLVEGRWINPAKWHVTIIHFGKVQDVYADLLTHMPMLQEETFLAALQTYAAHSATVLQKPITLQPKDYDLFGDHKSVFVIRFNTPPELIAAHQQALGYLLQFFKDIGLQDAEAFMRINHNFQHAPDLKPHLTLARHVLHNLKELPLPKQPLEFLPADIAGL
jgi:2'-5' RNA ligase